MSKADEARQLLRKMLLIRRFETTISELAEKKELPGWLHLSIGQEAVAVGSCAPLKKDDWVVSGHRAHGHAIAKGMALRSLAAELYGRNTGCCRGLGGSMHLADSEWHILTTSFVGQGYNLASGLGLSSDLRNRHEVVAAFGGDGSTNTGAFHESLNLCAVWKLPVVFIIENNGYAVSTPFAKSTSVARVAARASGYGIPGVTVDGNDVWAVRDAVSEAVDRARGGAGPSLVECLTYRHHGHYEGEQWEVYRSADELKKWTSADPITVATTKLEGFGAGEVESLTKDVQAEVDDAIAFANSSPFPAQDDLGKYVVS